MLIPDPAAADPKTDYRPTYPVPIGGPGSPRHEFRTLRQIPVNAKLTDGKFEEKYGLPIRTTLQILGPKSGERNAGIQGVSEGVRNSILANGGPDIGSTPRGSLDRRRKALIAAAAAEVPRTEAAAQDPVLGARAASALPDSPQRGAGDGPAKRPRLDTGLHNEPSMSGQFMAYQDVPLRPFNLAENPDTRLVSPPSPDIPAAAPQGGGSRSPSPDPFIDSILQSFKD
jgi:hypothetical protein